MNTDERLRSDAAQLEALLEGRASESDPAVRAVLERRPEWREVLEHARSAPAAEAPWSGEASEADRRLVAECLAQAREPAARSAPANAPARPARRPWGRLLALAAATLAVAWLARLWWGGDVQPVRPKGAVLESAGKVGFFDSGGAAGDFSQFKWTSRGFVPGKEVFVLTVWALDSSGARGDQLFRFETQDFRPETRESICKVSPEECASWPDHLIWRVSCFSTSDTLSASQDFFAERSGR